MALVWAPQLPIDSDDVFWGPGASAFSVLMASSAYIDLAAVSRGPGHRIG
jgi:hypothetical protein